MMLEIIKWKSEDEESNYLSLLSESGVVRAW